MQESKNNTHLKIWDEDGRIVAKDTRSLPVSNTMYVSVSMLGLAIEALKKESRVQVSASVLRDIQTKITRSCTNAISCGVNNLKILGNISAVSDMIDVLLSSDRYIETDSETKVRMAQRLEEAYIELKLEAAKFYMNHRVKVSRAHSRFMAEIVETCLQNQMYLNLESLVLEDYARRNEC